MFRRKLLQPEVVSIKVFFWLSAARIKLNLFEHWLSSLPRPSEITDYEIKVSRDGETISELKENILSSFSHRQTQSHVIITGDEEIERNIYDGNKLFISLISDLIPFSVYSNHYLLVCNFIPDTRYSNLTLYKELYEETAVGLSVVIAAEVLSNNLHFLDLRDDFFTNGTLNLDLFLANANALNLQGTQVLIKSVLENLYFLLKLP